MYWLSRLSRSKREDQNTSNYLGTKKSDLSILPKQFVVVDIETTGLDSEKHEIIEIGAIKVNRDSDVHTTYTALVKPEKRMPQHITVITGITQEMLVQNGENLTDVMHEFLSFVGDLRLVFFNAPFDYAFLSKAAHRNATKIDNPVSCALSMARRAWPGLQSYKLSELAKMGGLDTRGNHRALKDCELTMIVYAAAAEQLHCVN